MALRHSIRHSRKPTHTQTSWFYFIEPSYCRWKFWMRELGFRIFLLLWPWSWPDELHIRTWPVFPRDVPDVRKRRSRLSTLIVWQTDIQTDGQTVITIMYHNYIPRCIAGGQSFEMWITQATSVRLNPKGKWDTAANSVNANTNVSHILRRLKYLRHDSSAIDGYLRLEVRVFKCVFLFV